MYTLTTIICRRQLHPLSHQPQAQQMCLALHRQSSLLLRQLARRASLCVVTRIDHVRSHRPLRFRHIHAQTSHIRWSVLHSITIRAAATTHTSQLLQSVWRTPKSMDARLFCSIRKHRVNGPAFRRMCLCHRADIMSHSQPSLTRAQHLRLLLLRRRSSQLLYHRRHRQ